MNKDQIDIYKIKIAITINKSQKRYIFYTDLNITSSKSVYQYKVVLNIYFLFKQNLFQML